MISLFGKLQREKLLKTGGSLLDLGCGDGKIDEQFFKAGYDITLVDIDKEVLLKAEKNLLASGDLGLRTKNIPIEKFEFDENYDGVIISNVLSFQNNKESVNNIVKESFKHLDIGGFLFFTLFGEKDEWNNKRKDMIFYSKSGALKIIEDQEPYFVSEDYGRGITMKGDIKTWHVFHMLYIKT